VLQRVRVAFLCRQAAFLGAGLEDPEELNPTQAAALLREEKVIRTVALRHLLSFFEPSGN